MNDVDKFKQRARDELAEAVRQYGFVRANWGKLSMIVIAAAVIGAVVGATFF